MTILFERFLCFLLLLMVLLFINHISQKVKITAPKIVKNIILTSSKPSAYINFLDVPIYSMVRVGLDEELVMLFANFLLIKNFR